MRIYLTKYETMSTETTKVISDAVFPQRVHWFPETYDKAKTGLFQAPKRIADRLVTEDIVKHVCNNKAPGKIGFILAGGSQVWGTGGVPLYDQCLTNSLAYAYKVEVLNVTNIFGARIASQLHANDYVATDASTCASSLKVLMDVRHLIRDYGFDRVYVLGLEDSITNTVMNFFGSAKANICLDDEARGAVPSAFDSKTAASTWGREACWRCLSLSVRCLRVTRRLRLSYLTRTVRRRTTVTHWVSDLMGRGTRKQLKGRPTGTR